MLLLKYLVDIQKQSCIERSEKCRLQGHDLVWIIICVETMSFLHMWLAEITNRVRKVCIIKRPMEKEGNS